MGYILAIVTVIMWIIGKMSKKIEQRQKLEKDRQEIKKKANANQIKRCLQYSEMEEDLDYRIQKDALFREYLAELFFDSMYSIGVVPDSSLRKMITDSYYRGRVTQDHTQCVGERVSIFEKVGVVDIAKAIIMSAHGCLPEIFLSPSFNIRVLNTGHDSNEVALAFSSYIIRRISEHGFPFSFACDESGQCSWQSIDYDDAEYIKNSTLQSRKVRQRKREITSSYNNENRYKAIFAKGYTEIDDFVRNELKGTTVYEVYERKNNLDNDLWLLAIMSKRGDLPSGFLRNGVIPKISNFMRINYPLPLHQKAAEDTYSVMKYANEKLKEHGVDPIVLVHDRFDKYAKFYYLDDPDIDIYKPWEYVWKPMLYR